MRAEKLGLKRLEELGEEKVVEAPVGVGTGAIEPRCGIERELRVVRVGPNPRMVVCEYWELAERRVCIVNVKRNVKWMRGMKFKMEEPRVEEEYIKPWIYKGKQPRLRGRW